MSAVKVGVVGAGYVGLTTAVCLAERGLDTACVDLDADKVGRLKAGDPVIDEPGLQLLLRSGVEARNLSFHTDYDALADRDVVFVCVPTPSSLDGAADLRAVEAAVNTLGAVLSPPAVVALKSTVPVGTTRRMAARLRDRGLSVACSPEFLRESHAVYDFRNPDRVVIGSETPRAVALLRNVYGVGSQRIIEMSPESAELAKYASNAFLAVKLSYANSLARLCARTGADIADVTRCMGADVRIGGHFLQPGPGWGGSCLPKDTAALLHAGRGAGVDLPEVAAARTTNDVQNERITTALERLLPGGLPNAKITALGLTFKAHTTDTRDSPALRVCGRLAAAGAQVSGYDPRLGSIDAATLNLAGVVGVDDPYVATKAANAILVLTEWPQFRDLDWPSIAEQAPGAVVLDTRNLLNSNAIAGAGLQYLGNGTPGGY
ncbi:UDP-glucose/GDP-mannose dehydrogenase family protein [Mycolicibacterium sp. P1-5]|uniref:UDP-glucose dehydrogenase family protein n=1 Tax=Mycolicibacterium sp. P1-5 TaxID=2024617 RepID=UPI0011EDC282|nr:UDP-glucose/GDP-mannose dehydrogenase family protein [Mycolicibacterium sp. P1-5]KAA0104637.1 UDP-glucose/GDP-mannose dehydrogenase family protein [Mycolicibacterium sp. P1-5]